MTTAERHEEKAEEFRRKAIEANEDATEAETAAATAKSAWLAAKMHAETLRDEANRLKQRAETEWVRAEAAKEAVAEATLTADDREAIEAAQEYCEILEDDEDESDKWSPSKTAEALERLLAKTK